MRRLYFVLLSVFLGLFLVSTSVLPVSASKSSDGLEIETIKTNKRALMDDYKTCLREVKDGRGSMSECNSRFQTRVDLDKKDRPSDLVSRKNRDGAISDRKTRREEYRERLLALKDERVQRIIERVDSRLDSLNERWARHANTALDRLSSLLAKIESRTDKAEEAGRDVSSVREAIVSAETAISEAQAVVYAQASTDYVITINDETNLGSDVSSAIDLFQSDVSEVKESIKKAHGAVKQALRTLQSIRDVDTD